eukprot:3577224-Amphidinium_carterae.1
MQYESVPQELKKDRWMGYVCTVLKLMHKKCPSQGVALMRLLFNGMAYPKQHIHAGRCCWCHETHTGHPTYGPLFRGCFRRRLGTVRCLEYLCQLPPHAAFVLLKEAAGT